MKIFAFILFCIVLTGCVPSLTPFEQKSLQAQKDAFATQAETLKEQQATAFAKQEEALKENAAKGKQSPLINPIDATNQTVVELHPWLFDGTIAFAILAVLCLGLSAIGPVASTIAWLAWLKPVGEIAQVFEPFSVRAFCITFTALMLLPFVKVSAIAGVVSLVVLFIYEMVINKGNLQTVLSSIVNIVTGGNAAVAISNGSTGSIK